MLTGLNITRRFSLNQKMTSSRRNARLKSKKTFSECDAAESTGRERLRNLRLRDLQVFLKWYIRKQKMRELESLLTRIKNWNMMYRDDVNRNVEKEIIQKINIVRSTVLL